jgi:hypothetical protein
LYRLERDGFELNWHAYLKSVILRREPSESRRMSAASGFFAHLLALHPVVDAQLRAPAAVARDVVGCRVILPGPKSASARPLGRPRAIVDENPSG